MKLHTPGLIMCVVSCMSVSGKHFFVLFSYTYYKQIHDVLYEALLLNDVLYEALLLND